MLTRLSIRDFALLRDTEIHFKSGFTAITGETGTGKSLLIGAVRFLVGGRPALGVVRDGAKTASIMGEFTMENGDSLLLSRELFVDGRTRACLDSKHTSLKRLETISSSLVDITSQRAFSHLLDTRRHLDFLDAYSKLDAHRKRLSDYYSAYIRLKHKIDQSQNEMEELDRRREFVEFQLNEINKVDPEPDEDAELLSEIRRFENVESIHEAGHRLDEILRDGQNSIESQMSEASRLLVTMAGFDDELSDLPDELEVARGAIREISQRVLDRWRKLDYDTVRLEKLRDRQHQLAGIIRKYGGNLRALLEIRNKLDTELNSGNNARDKLKELHCEKQELIEKWCVVATQVGEIRRKKAAALEKKVSESLAKLGVKNGKFEVRVEMTPEDDGLYEYDGKRWHLDGRGAETVELYLSTNPGLEPRPLTQVASGGELSRLLLSIKETIPVGSSEATVIFDEIDTGVSGRVASLVGKKLKDLSQKRQLIAITHLPQIAGLADHHLCVTKRVTERGTETDIIELKNSARVEEIAKLLSGGGITDAALQQARNLIITPEE